MRRVCVFCGSSAGRRARYAEAARDLAAELARGGLGLVYGGGSVGLMGVLADAALARGIEVIGVIPRALAARELAHRRLTQLHTVDSMHERKALMGALVDGFVALPGGLGTLEETLEVLTWSQLGIHRKPVGLLNVERYYDDLLRLLRRGVREGFVRREYAGLLVARTAPRPLLRAMTGWRPPAMRRVWLEPAQA